MTEKELKRLRRSDLLEILLAISRENDQLREELEQTRAQLEERNLAISQSGTLAEAALRLNCVFSAADAACKQYEENMRIRCEEMEQQTREKCEAILLAANEQAAQVIQASTTDEDE